MRAASEIGQIAFSDSLRVIVRLAFYQQMASGVRVAQLPAFTYPLAYQNKRHGSCIPASAMKKDVDLPCFMLKISCKCV